MAICKKVIDRRPNTSPNTQRDVTQPFFAFPPNNALAQVIVDLWQDTGHILDRHNNRPTQQAVDEATQKIRAAGFDLKRAVIITEDEHDDDYFVEDELEVVFVLPNKKRVIDNPAHLLDTAKLLMACTPNGI
ncbi:hypothetical protein [Bradyrhizobium cenepequi]